MASKSGEWARASRKPCLSASRGLLVATALMMRLCHMDAAFTPRNRAELQGDGQSTAGVFGCVGSCGQSLFKSEYCHSSANGPWESGSGGPCNNADVLVPVGQGSGTYGAIGDWDVSSVASMSFMFRYAESFNQAVGDWDVSSVTSMESMFDEAQNFNQAVGDWDVSSVASMHRMFSHAKFFNQAVGDWDVSSVADMHQMFYKVESFNQAIGDWDVSSVAKMSQMFRDAENFNQPPFVRPVWVDSFAQKGSMFNGVTNGSIATVARCPFAGTYWLRGSGQCPDCPEGHHQPHDESSATACTACPQGYIADHVGAVKCTPCDAGTHQNDSAKAFCLPCLLGEYQNYSGQPLCTPCAKGQYSADVYAKTPCTLCESGTYGSETGQSRCVSCGVGKWSDTLGAFDNSTCKDCPTGTYSSVTGLDLNQSCTKCSPGRYSNTSGATDAYDCQACLKGQFQPSLGQTACLACLSGWYASTPGSLSCVACPPGQFAFNRSAIGCESCLAGQFQNASGQSACRSCLPGSGNVGTGNTGCDRVPRGSYVNASSTVLCDVGYECAGGAADREPCLPGFYAEDSGSIKCIACAPGKYASANASETCTDCPQGYFQPSPNATACYPKMPGTIVLSRVADVEVPLGSYIMCSKTECDFAPCLEGTYGENPPNATCKECLAGQSSFNSSIACTPCRKGTFAPRNGSLCRECPHGFFQPQSATPSTRCERCPAGYAQNATGESACTSLGWLHPEDCTSEQYLNNTDANRQAWQCVTCPAGGSCLSTNATWDTLDPMFGFWKIPAADRTDAWYNVFAECDYHPACLGGPNPALAGRYLDEDGQDLADKRQSANYSQPCATELGFKASSRLCHACAQGHRRQGANQCAQCPQAGQNWVLIVLGVFLILGMLVYVVSSTLSQGDKMDLSQSVQKIMLSYLQVIALAQSFPLRWPASLRTLFEIQGAVSTLGDHIVNVDCISASESGAELFYGKQVMYALVPLLTGLLGFLFWYAYGMRRGVPFFAKRTEPKDKTPKDKFVVTVTAIVFLMYPTLCTQAFSVFSCRWVGTKQYLQVDFQESCYMGRHFAFVLALGMPQLLLYVFGLPLLVLGFLRRYASAITTEEGLFAFPPVVTRWGLFFKSYKPNRYFWETIVSARKVSVVALSVFGKELGVERQSQVALFLLLVCIVLEISGEPFRELTDAHAVLRRLELSALLVAWGTFWCGLMIHKSGPKSEGMNIFMTVSVIVCNVVLTLWFLRVLVAAYVAENKDSAVAKCVLRVRKRLTLALDRRSSASFEENQTGSVEEKASASLEENQAASFEENPLEQELELSQRWFSKHMTAEGRDYYVQEDTNKSMMELPPDAVVQLRKRKFTKHTTAEGRDYYVEEGTNESVWKLPPDGELV